MNARDLTNASAMTDLEIPVPENDTSMIWSDERLLGFTPMDDVHEEFYEVVLRLVTCTDTNAVAAIEAFAKHAVSHFEQEDEWMRTTNFPPRDCHVEEHAAVFRSVCEVKAAVEAGQISADAVHDFGMHLFGWFPGHADYLDSALAAWMTKQTMGGKPVVLRRTKSSTSREQQKRCGTCVQDPAQCIEHLAQSVLQLRRVIRNQHQVWSGEARFLARNIGRYGLRLIVSPG